MENKKNLGVIGLVVLCLAVSAIFGIAYATFTQDLTIGGSATVNTTNWEVKWSSISKNTDITTAGLNVTVPSGVSRTTQISGFDATFTQPGQKVAFDFKVKNYGDFDAKLTAVTNLSNLKNNVQCSIPDGSSATSTDVTNVCNNVTLEIKKGNDNLALNNVSTLSTNDEETYTLILSYNVDPSDTTGTNLPSAPVLITVNDITFTYTQQI